VLQIKMKSDSLPVSWTEDGLICSDGSHLKADVVVFATGFVCDLKLIVAELFGPQVAMQLEDFWGLDEEGEIKGAFKPTGRKYTLLSKIANLTTLIVDPAFWFHGGAIGQARYMARFIALQVKAKLLGTPLPFYDGNRRGQKL
jgi:hypothetical protein